MDKDRELFEAKFPPSKWIEWCDNTNRYQALVMNSEDLDDAASHNLAFAAWQEATKLARLTEVDYTGGDAALLRRRIDFDDIFQKSSLSERGYLSAGERTLVRKGFELALDAIQNKR